MQSVTGGRTAAAWPWTTDDRGSTGELFCGRRGHGVVFGLVYRRSQG